MKKKLAIIFLIIAAVLVPFGIMANNTKKYEGKILPNVCVKGIDLGGLTKEEAIKTIENEYNDDVKNKVIKINYKDFQYKISYKRLKAHYDVETAVNMAYEYSNTGDIIGRTARRMNLKSNTKQFALNFIADTSIVEQDVKKIASRLNQKPEDAKISYNGNFTTTKDKDGIEVDKPKLSQLINKSINPIRKDENIDVPVKVVHAKIREEMLSKINSKIAGFSTAFRLSDPNRVGNIKIAAKGVDGSIILPGENFSMNEVLGPRIASKGYKEAHVIVNGALANGMAGGICQVSSTVYNAALLANFPIVERRPHGLKVGYVDAGRDATISGSAIDFKFKNSNTTPIYIQSYVNGGTVSVNVFGANEHPGQSVVIKSQIVERVEGKVETIKDLTLPIGATVIESRPISGIKSVTYRKVYQNGKLVKNELLSKDFYKPTKGIIKIGPEKQQSSVLPSSKPTLKSN